jgi:DNA-binding transcriptional MerR regulator
MVQNRSMRIGVVAQAAETTARAVRHYHQLGVLPEPIRTPAGYRDYSMNDLVRLMRIRRLAESGVPLGAISAMTTVGETDENDVIGHLSDLIEGIEREQESLRVKKCRLLALLEDARAGRSLTALPRPLSDRLSELIDQSDAITRPELERERDHLEVLALSGNLPEQWATAMTDSLRTPESVATYMTALARWSALSGEDPAGAKDRIDTLGVDIAALLLTSNVFSYSAHSPPQDTDSLPDLSETIPDPAQRAVVLRVASILAEGAEA